MRMFDVRATRVLVNEITKCGATFYDVLKSEPGLHVLTWPFVFTQNLPFLQDVFKVQMQSITCFLFLK
jgi:hypothetical protein